MVVSVYTSSCDFAVVDRQSGKQAGRAVPLIGGGEPLGVTQFRFCPVDRLEL